jgi:NADH:ubiquinone oxidoreductase subunit E
MIYVEVCIGSSCHLKGAPDIVALLEEAVRDNGLEDSIVLSGSFCAAKCNRIGVTVSVNETAYTDITKDNFAEFWKDKIMKAAENDTNRDTQKDTERS